MSFTNDFGPHLPFLRRYARALTGSQTSGDAYIKASLMALAGDPSQVGEYTNAKLALYKYFHVIWSETGAKLQGDDELASDTPDLKLQALAPVERQAFLLTAVEGFSVDEAAIILDATGDEISSLIHAAQASIEAGLKTSVMIVEDEPIIAADIESLVESMGHEVTGIATTRSEAIELAKKQTPGLILCDIQLADDSSGIDAVHDILGEIDVPVIFVTAFPERLLTGEKPEPTYLVSKPFQENTLIATIGQALFFHPANKQN